MVPSDFASADLSKIVDELTTEEAISLIAGVGFWHTHAIPRLNIPAVKVSDGPNGIRGNHFFMGIPAKCLPSATALGATFDPELVHEVGFKLLAPEAKFRAASVVLAPTCNIQRNPLGGRSFESFSEDPYLSGMLAAAYVKGIQDGGVGTAIKHFVCNDKEDDRFSYDSILSERALREIYLMPFMLAQKYAQPWSYMTAYNRINGIHASENKYLLQDILRNEWGFQGLVMSDWTGVYSVDHSINAGLDLEMPGTNKWRTSDLVNRSIRSRKVLVRTVKERARNVLDLVQKCAKYAPEILDGDGKERTVESEEDKLLMEKIAADSIVLLKNNAGLLPLRCDRLKKVAIIGGNAKATILSGGGSAALKPSYFISPYEGIVNALPKDVEVSYSEGARAYLTLPVLDNQLTTETGERGWVAEWFSHINDESMTPVDTPIASSLVDETRLLIFKSTPPGITRRWTLKLRGQLRTGPPSRDTKFEFSLASAGRAKLLVDGHLVIDNWTRQRRGDTFFGAGSQEERGVFDFQANKSHSIFVEFCNVRAPADGDEAEAVMDIMPGVRLGGIEAKNEDQLVEEAVQLAREADVVIAIVGLNADWETEGNDRKTLALPHRTDELIEKVAKANKNTVVVTQSGSSITMPWVDSVSTIVHSWYLGNATGVAIANVLFGIVNPAAKLSLTFPKRLEDVPSYASFQSENGKIRYSEDLNVGYKHYHNVKIQPLFDFGHGLSYTTFNYSELKLSEPIYGDDDVSLNASLTLTNSGPVTGSEVVQLYVTMPDTSELSHPPLQLKAFKKVRDLKPGAKTEVVLKLDKYAVSYWEERIARWVVERGKYNVRIGGSSSAAGLVLKGNFVIEKSFEWKGL